MTIRGIFFMLSLIFLLAPAGWARTAENDSTEKIPLRIPKVNSHLKIDAHLDEPQWAEALIVPANIEVRPGENITSPVVTEALLMYDDENIYAGFRCYDPEPHKIRAHYSDRDNLWSDDWILILFDTFNDNRRSYDFFSNPFGVQADEIESTTGGGSWDAIWESHGRITDEGYIVEMAIPFRTMGFQRTPEDQIWGFDVVRSYPRTVRHHIGSFPRDRNNNCYMCQALKLIGFAGATPGRNIEFNPTLSGIQSAARADGPDSPMQDGRGKADAGLNARWGLTPNVTLNGTINPDFSQIEADVQQLDINRQFAIFYPEKRPFFMEGADFFDSMLPVIYTRSLADPRLGVKLTGKEGRHTVGFFSAQDEITNLVFPGAEGSNSASMNQRNMSTVFRYKHDIGDASNLGMLVTDREGDNYYNRMGGLDGNLKFTQKDILRFQALGSRTLYPQSIADEYDQSNVAFAGSALNAHYEHNTRNYFVYGFYRQASPDYRADAGFMSQTGIRYSEVGGNIKFQRDPGSWFTWLSLYSSYDFRRDWAYRPLHQAYTTRLNYEGPLQTFAGAYGEYGRDHFQGREYRMHWMQAWVGMRPSAFFNFELFSRFGDQIDYDNSRQGRSFSISPWMVFRPGVHLNIELAHTYEYLDVDPGRLYTANISRVKLVYQFNKRIFVRAILQYLIYDRSVALYTDPEVEPQTKALFSQWLFSYKINPTTVLFLGYSDNYDGDRENRLYQSNRTFFTKIGYAWRI